jgi:metallo-beta-lactamase family protein
VLFVGWQAEGTLGRYILEGVKKVRMMGMEIAVKATIRKINSFSAHADYEDIIRWMKGYKKPAKRVFIVHGEEKAAKALKLRLKKIGLSCHVPDLGENVVL